MKMYLAPAFCRAKKNGNHEPPKHKTLRHEFELDGTRWLLYLLKFGAKYEGLELRGLLCLCSIDNIHCC